MAQTAAAPAPALHLAKSAVQPAAAILPDSPVDRPEYNHCNRKKYKTERNTAW
jgi:hypothetical protein